MIVIIMNNIATAIGTYILIIRSIVQLIIIPFFHQQAS